MLGDLDRCALVDRIQQYAPGNMLSRAAFLRCVVEMVPPRLTQTQAAQGSSSGSAPSSSFHVSVLKLQLASLFDMFSLVFGETRDVTELSYEPLLAAIILLIATQDPIKKLRKCILFSLVLLAICCAGEG